MRFAHILSFLHKLLHQKVPESLKPHQIRKSGVSKQGSVFEDVDTRMRERERDDMRDFLQALALPIWLIELRFQD